MPDRPTKEVVASRYALHEVLGRGGWGRVWRARDSLLDRDVAVKEITVPLGVSPGERRTAEERVLREAQAAARIPHPGAVTVYDVVRQEGRAFIVMELVRGRSLARVVAEEGALSPERAAVIGRDVVATLEAAHAQGIVHRDVKPQNVMIAEDGRVRLTDFGIATLRDQATITLSGQVLGSPQYMAPEQARGERSSPATDLWGLGATLYFAVEGRSPFGREHPLATLSAVVNEEPSAPTRAGALRPVIDALLRKDPEERPGSDRVTEMLEVAAGRSRRQAKWPTEPISTTTSPGHPGGGECRARWSPILLVGGLLALVASVWFVASLQEEGDLTTGRSAQPSSPVEQPSPAGLPEGWTEYQDPAVGYRIAHPRGWEVSAVDATRTDFRDPRTGAFLRVDWTDQPGPDPVAAWESYSDDFAAQHEGYREIRIDPADFQGYEAAEWEFTFREGGTTLHALDLGFVTGDHGFALFFQAPEAAWADMQDEFEAFKASFRPPG